jgi:Beta helix repeat
MKFMLQLLLCMASLWPGLSTAVRAVSYNIADGSVNVMDSEPYLIYGTSTVNTITVNSGMVADVTLSNLNVQVTNRFQCAFSVVSNTTMNLSLVGSNFLMSGRYEAGLYVPAGATLNITNGDANGLLTVIGGGNAAGIGSGKDKQSGRISINGGNITAVGGAGGAGIGCGDNGGDGGIITIAGGTVVAQGGGLGEAGCGAGIGGGNASAGGVITITGGKVTATGGELEGVPGYGGAGIGGGTYAPGGLITISGGTVFATRGGTNAKDIGSGASTTSIGTNGFFSGSIKTSADAVWGAPVGVESHAAYLLIVSNAVDGTNSVSISLTNMQTDIPYSYTGSGHGSGDYNLYFYLPAGDYPADSTETLGFFVNADGPSGSMSDNPSDWTDEQRGISALLHFGDANMLVLTHPLGTLSDHFSIEGADKVEENGWNWSIIPHTTDDNGVITIYTNVPALMLRLHY